MPDVKNQHYVPQFYLRKFVGNDELVYAFDKFKKRSFPTIVRNIASETRFYDIHPDVHKEFRERVARGEFKQDETELITKALDPQMIERELAEREANFASVFEVVLEAIRQKKLITEEQRWHLTEFIVMQILRTPESRREHIELQMNLFTELLRRTQKSDADELYLEFDERYASLEHAQVMFDPGLQLALCQTLANHIWLIGINMSSDHFYTSDTPIVKRSHLNNPFMGTGLGSLSVEVAFPLSPEYMLILCERKAFHHLHQFDLHTLPLTSENVVYYNSLQVLQSYRYVYCPFGEFLKAVEICWDHPEVCTPNRKRVEVG